MQLPLTGHPLHTRALNIVASVRADGRWRVRGDVIDLRKCGFVPMLEDLQPAGIIHQMTIDAVVDPATRILESLDVDQPFVAIEPSSETAGECCRDPAPRLQAFAGERFDAELARKLSAGFGGALGCSHLLTLFQLMASALPRALDTEAALAMGARRPGERPFRRAAFVDGHEADDGSIGLGVQITDTHTAPGPVAQPLDRLAEQRDVRLFARVRFPGLELEELQAGERVRTRATVASAPWRDRTADVGSLAGSPLIPGLAGRAFRALGPLPDARLLLDAALQLAPGHIQVMAAITDRWFAQAGDVSAPDRNNARSPRGDLPEIASMGGFPDSCYMWRTGGPLQDRRERGGE